MPNPLESFLNKYKSGTEEVSGINVSGSFQCQECEDVVQDAKLSYEDKVIQWTCTLGHFSQVALDV
jgi:hypothetical protein